MTQIDNRTTIERSYRVLGLLSVCEQSARHIEDLRPDEYKHAAGALASTLGLAHEIAGEVHDALEVGKVTKLDAA